MIYVDNMLIALHYSMGIKNLKQCLMAECEMNNLEIATRNLNILEFFNKSNYCISSITSSSHYHIHERYASSFFQINKNHFILHFYVQYLNETFVY